MQGRLHPLWWPALALGSPVLLPSYLIKAQRFRGLAAQVHADNLARLQRFRPLTLPPLQRLRLQVLSEWRTRPGFMADAAVSYRFDSDQGGLLMDVGHGDENPAVTHNAARLGFDPSTLDALIITHLHLDHMGGMAAMNARDVRVPPALLPGHTLPCFTPEAATGAGLELQVATTPRLLPSGWATTGPLGRQMFFRGRTEEQAIFAHLEGRGLVVVTGCGHPTIQLILRAVRRLSDLPIYAIMGGLHYPLTHSRSSRSGLAVQRIFATGRPPHLPLNDRDLNAAIQAIQDAHPTRVLLSAHDSCDHAIGRMQAELDADVQVLAAGDQLDL